MNTALHIAITHNYSEVAKLVVRQRAILSLRNGNGLSPLQMAFQDGLAG